MFYDTTFSNKERTKAINAVMGKPFGLVERIKMGGIGSPRFIVEEVSPSFEIVMNRKSNVNYATIELRPNGIIIHFAKALKSFAWLIPYYKLSIFQAETIKFYSENKFIQIKRDNQWKALQRFIRKLLKSKTEYVAQTRPPL